MSEGPARWRGWGFLALAFVVLLGWWIHRSSDRQQILRQLGKLEAKLEKEEQESDLVAMAQGREILELFANPFSLAARPYEGRLTTAQEFLIAWRRYRSLGESVRVEMATEELLLRDNGTASLVFQATVTVDFGDRTGRESYLVASAWVNGEPGWRIQDLEVLEVLVRDDGFGLFRE